ncbi:transmembrane sensor/regulator PpyR [Metapseudomonas otitidis]|uniref:transmembrane sensor/regulator PpyR n=1 Tax=Metapseudomonas otitidis TaxID=319939 RepID=UPI0013F5DF28|nr:transmembrane sensor/regulator PpyR [Pseudomonas otitidis]
MCPVPCPLLSLAHGLLAAGLALLLVGVVGAYGLDHYLALPAQVLAHGLVILGPTLIKVGYVIRLTALQRLHRGACHATA